MRKRGFLIALALMFLMMLLFGVFSSSSYAANMAEMGCCISTDSCLPTTSGSCSGSQIYYALACSAIPRCDVGCCCQSTLNAGNVVVTIKNHCDSVSGQFFDLRSFTTNTYTYINGCKAVCGLQSGACSQDLKCSDQQTVLADCTSDGTYAVMPGAICPGAAGSLVDTDGDDVPDSEDLCPNEPMLAAPAGTTETACRDNIDNDCDNMKDCDDADCCIDTACLSSTTCIITTCGNNVINAGEECDDGGRENGDGCNNICKDEYCGDGIIQPGLGEQCDDQNTNNDDQCGNSCRLTIGGLIGLTPAECDDGIDNDYNGCADWPFDTGCSSESDNEEKNGVCTYCGDNTLQTPNSGGINEDCEADSQCGSIDGQSGTCQNDCSCLYSCLSEPGMTEGIEVIPVKGEFANEIRWELHPSTNCVPEKVYTYRCSGPMATCTPNELIVENLTTYANNALNVFYYHKDRDIAPDSRYCYRVDVYYRSGAASKSDVICITTGDAQCMASKDEFCMDNKRYECDDQNLIIEPPIQDCSPLSVESDDYVCVGPLTDGSTKCLYQSECKLCNGLFGLFMMDAEAFYKEGSSASNIGGGDYPCSEIPTCYNDTTRTTVNKYHECYGIESCYDYKSEGACTENKCQTGECEWAESQPAFSELGIGVCRPVNDNLQNCSICGVFRGESNNLIYEDCDVELCKLYGECYYSYNQCGKDDVSSCWSYTTEDDCIGAGSDAQNASVNTVWNNVTIWQRTNTDGTTESYKRFMKVGDDNILTEASNDYFGYGLCRWVGYAGSRTDVPSEICARDADNDSQPDCGYGIENRACQIDNKAPQTTFILEGHPLRISDNRVMLPKKIDITYQTDEKATVYFCFAEAGDVQGNNPACYPNETSMCGLQKVFEGPTGEYRMYYFAEDRSHNLETVRWIDVYIDTNIPEIMGDDMLIQGSDGNDYKISMTSNKQVSCAGMLMKGNGVPTRTENLLEFEIDTGFTRDYYDLSDDNYYFEYDCHDYAGNEVKGKVPVNDPSGVDTNRIHDPSPKGPTHETTVTLSVETDENANCSYARFRGFVPAYEAMTPFASVDRLAHTKTVTASSNEYYDYVVKCKFADGTVEGDDNDRIVFSVDDKGPSVYAVTSFEAVNFDASQTWGRDQEIRLLCKDDYFKRVKNVMNMDFGCDDILFKKTDPLAAYETMDLDQDGLSMTILSLVGTGMHKVYYVANDTGNNSEEDDLTIMINSEPPDFGIEVYPYPLGPGSNPLTSLSYGYYTVKVASTKSLNDVNLSLVVQGMTMTSSFLYSEDYGKTNYFMLRIPYPEEGGLPRGPSYTGDILVTGLVRMPGSACSFDEVDEESLVGTGVKAVTIETADPDVNLEPALDDYHSIGYPLRKAGSMYYTNETRLFITGSRNNLAVDEVWFYVLSGDDIMSDMANPQKIYSFRSNMNSDPLSLLAQPLSVAPPLATAGMDSFYLTPLTISLDPANYLKINGKERKSYGHYREHYNIDWVENIGGYIAKATLAQPLENDLAAADKVDIYTRPYPSDWFGEYIDLEPGNNTFYVRPRSVSGVMPLQEQTYVIFNDPNPPYVVSQTPRRGTTNNIHTVVSIVVREGIRESLLDTTNITLAFNNQIITNATNPADFDINEYAVGGFVYYEIIYTPPAPLIDGNYDVKFTAKDKAGHELADTPQASAAWSFTIDTKAPSTPILSIENGTFYPRTGGLWYVNRSPGFTLEFTDIDPVNITGIFKDQPFAGFNIGTNCRYVRNSTTNNMYICLFDPALQPMQLESSGQIFIDDTFQIIAEAYKTLASGQRSPKGVYYLDPLVIDNITPGISSVVYPSRVKVDGDVIFKAFIRNEFHDLNATLNGTVIFNDEKYQLEQVNRQYGMYEFKWHTPYYDTSQTNLDDIMNNLTLRIADYAGNFNFTNLGITIDLKVPDIRSMHVSVLPTIEEQIGEYRTRYTTVIVMGNFTDDDIKEIFIIPGNYIPGQQIYDNVSQIADIYGKNFLVEMRINGTINETILNKMNIFLVDEAGYKVFLPLDVVADLEPPRIITSSITSAQSSSSIIP